MCWDTETGEGYGCKDATVSIEKIQGTHSNCIFEIPCVFPVFPVPLQIFPVPIYVIFLGLFTANIELSFTFIIREFTTWANQIPCVLAKFPNSMCSLTVNIFDHFPCFPCAVGSLIIPSETDVMLFVSYSSQSVSAPHYGTLNCSWDDKDGPLVALLNRHSSSLTVYRPAETAA